jgi:hypothetical protein
MKKSRLLGALCALALFGMGCAANAGLIQTFSFDGNDITGSGEIVFGSASGSTIGDLDAYSVSGTYIGESFSFDLGDVTSVSFSLDAVDWSITSLLVTAESAGIVTHFNLTGTSVIGQCSTSNAVTCGPGLGGISKSTAVTFQSAVPIPPALWLRPAGADRNIQT